VDPISFLFSLERLGMKFGLENMRRICAALDDPQQRFHSVIVAGTNGKGSVTAMTSAALHAAGHRTARYTSPHLERLEERYVIGEREVSAGDLEAAAGTIQQTVERLVETGILETLPTFFECATAIAFELFRRAAVEVAVIEVGLGGRLDATNVISPMAAAITSIDFDHQDLLGNTLESIAREKAGVIKAGIPVIVGPLPEAAARVIASVCAEQHARLVEAARVRTTATVVDGRTVATFESERTHLDDVTVALSGRHQLANAAIVIALLEELDALGVAVGQNARRAGLTDARWPGRLERRQWHGAEILLDAAHNPAGARALADYLRDADWRDVTLVIGAMRDKDVAGILSPLVPFAATIVCTTAASPRAMPADELAELARRLTAAARIVAMPDPSAAITEAAGGGGRVVAAGSIFLIGPLRGILR
jgi:dihydrofolate synthase / folylpolyglutamate synthase